MRIRRNKQSAVMTEDLICINYMDVSTPHYIGKFVKVGDNEYKCENCGEVMIVKEPTLVLDDKGILNMQVEVSVRKEEEDNGST